jgi:hypothetical protein
MTPLHIASSIVLVIIAVIYAILSTAVNKKAIVNIDGIVYAFKKKPSIIPTLVAIAIIALVFISLHFSCFDCLSYTR